MSRHFPLVSIITPTYNHANYIGPCIESVLQQTYPNWEQIILDDGSTDGTMKIISSYCSPRILASENRHRGIEGVALTYNEALAKSKGELIAVLEGDDLWPPEKLSTLVPAFAEPRIILAYGGVRDCSIEGTVNRRASASMSRHQRLPHSVLTNNPLGSSGIYMTRADAIDLIPESTVIIRRTALEEIGGFQYVPGMCVASYPTFLKLSLLGTFHYTPQVMGFRRRHSRSASIQYSFAMLSSIEQCAKTFLRQGPWDVSDFEMTCIEETWRQAEYTTHFTAGRVSLVEKRWKDARVHFSHALSPHLPRTLVASLVGWMMAGLHCNLEGIIGLFGKARLTSGAIRGPRSDEGGVDA